MSKRQPPMKLSCEQCGKEFVRHVCNRRNTKHDFCSQICCGLFRKGKFHQTNINSLKNLIPAKSNEKHFNWKGDKAGYQALHAWIRKQLGEPNTCEYCGKSGLSGQKINWANKDHKYLRNRSDWLRLCASCHRYYDYAVN